MTDFKHRIKSDWPVVLKQILERAKALGPKGVLVFDLDSTLFDNRPRQARILREFGESRKHGKLAACLPEYFESGWDMKSAMVRCGLTPEEADTLFSDARKFWSKRFFTSEYCVDDVAIRGAAEFLASAKRTGVIIAYVTGRHEEMRAGTVQAMKNCGMVLPGGNVHLIMKPEQPMGDDEFKREAHAQIARLGELIAAFDNEPIHANDYGHKFPKALVIHLATDHSGRELTLLDAVVTIPHF